MAIAEHDGDGSIKPAVKLTHTNSQNKYSQGIVIRQQIEIQKT